MRCGTRLIGLVAMTDPEIEEPTPEQVYQTGTVAMIHKVVHTDDSNLQVIVQGLERFRVADGRQANPI